MKSKGKAPKLIKDFEAAVRADEESGHLPPEEWPAIEAALEKTRDALDEYIFELQAEAGS